MKIRVWGPFSLKYDPFGRRVEKISSSATSIYVYDGNNLVEETNSAGTAVARYTQGLNIDEPLAMLRGSTTSYYSADGLGSITSLTNSSGANAATYTYDSFGNLTASTGSLTNSFRYTAREFDTETSLYYYRARYYDTASGRFLSEDPIGFLGSGTNFYAYVRNNPIDLTDPFGLCPKNKKNCLLEALRKNGLSLAIDVAGLIPGESLAKTLFDIGSGVVGSMNSLNDYPGFFMGIAGIEISALKPLAKDIGGGLAKGIPILGTGLNVVSTGRDVYLTVEHYEKCTSEN
jgi:RHS repeat-associated protein